MFKNTILATLLLSMIAFCQKAPEAPKADASTPADSVKIEGTETALNAEKSTVKWIGTKVTGRHNGTVKISEGKVIVKENKVVGGNFTLDMTSIDDEDLKADKKMQGKLLGHLKSEDFFDVEKFPKASFEITSVKENADGTATISGNLTLKGIAKAISFPAKIANNAENKPASATANFNINRQDWGIKYPGKPDDLIRDEINIDLNLSL